MTAATVDALLAQVEAGTPLSTDDLTRLAASPEILPLGMMADAARRRLHGVEVTFGRVARCAIDGDLTGCQNPVAGEVRLTGKPASLEAATAAVSQVKAAAGDRLLSGFSASDLGDLAVSAGLSFAGVLGALRSAGLDTVADVFLDDPGDVNAVVQELVSGGCQQIRLGMRHAAADRTALFVRAAALHDRLACVRALSPLPAVSHGLRPTTGYDDVKAVALARLAAPNIPCIQVDWLRYGPKLAQVALTFGADDLDGVGCSDDAPDGRRRAPLEEVRRNIQAAGFTPVERDGRFTRLA